MNRLTSGSFLLSAVVFIFVFFVSMINVNRDSSHFSSYEPEMVYAEGSTVEIDGKQITIRNFFIGKYEITQKQWMAVMGSNPSMHQKGDNYPVENVSWDDTQEFINKLNSLTGKNYRLPTEMEWKYAARGGNKSKGYKYSGSNNIQDVAWFEDNANGSTHPVGTKQPNELGIYDMTGNVREWTGEFLLLESPGLGGARLVVYKLILGSCWINSNCGGFYAEYGVAEPHMRSNVFGFRLVLPIDKD